MATSVDLSTAGVVSEDRVPAGADGPTGKLAARVAGRIEAEIVRRGWPVGESLGSEPGLREQHGVSRAVLREAVRLVEHHQVARMRRGPNGGLFVCAPDAAPATRATVIYLEYVGTSVQDLLHARLLIEPLAVGLAAERITEEGIALLRRTLAAEGADDPAAMSEMWAHDPLHVVLGELSGNPVLGLFIDVLTRLTNRYAHLSERIPPAELARARGISHRSHALIVDAVIAGDAAHAQTRMSDYLTSVAAWLEEHRATRAPAGQRQADQPQPPEGPRAKLAEMVAARIHDDIAQQDWPVGEVLGSEAGLLERYGVSRAVLREAVRLLEYHAVARMRRGPGGGLVVARPEPQASIDTMALYLEYQAVTGEHLRVVREAIELGTVAAVTTRHEEPDVAGRLDAATRWVTEGPAEDAAKADRFHTELAELGGNPVLVLFLRIITELFRRHTSIQDVPPPGAEVAEQVRQIHERILDAILAGDEGLARHRMRRHLAALTPWWH